MFYVTCTKMSIPIKNLIMTERANVDKLFGCYSKVNIYCILYNTSMIKLPMTSQGGILTQVPTFLCYPVTNFSCPAYVSGCPSLKAG